MYTNLKNEIEKDFSKETNYNTIISKIERKKGILAPTCSLLIGIVGFIGVKNHLQKEELLIDKINVEQAMEEKEKDIININSYASNDIYDIDSKWLDTNLMEEFKFLNNIYIPEFLKETRQGKIYVRDGRDDENYSKFNQYSIIFFLLLALNALRAGMFLEPLSAILIVSKPSKAPFQLLIGVPSE